MLFSHIKWSDDLILTRRLNRCRGACKQCRERRSSWCRVRPRLAAWPVGFGWHPVAGDIARTVLHASTIPCQNKAREGVRGNELLVLAIWHPLCVIIALITSLILRATACIRIFMYSQSHILFFFKWSFSFLAELGHFRFFVSFLAELIV